MKRLKFIFSITMLILMSILFLSCTGKQVDEAILGTDELIGMLPNDVKSIGYADYNSIYNTNEFKNIIQKSDMAYAEELLKPFDEFILGSGKLKPEEITFTKEVVILASGDYDKETVTQLARNHFGFGDTNSINDTELITNNDWSFIFLDNVFAISKKGYEQKVIDSVKYSKNALDKNSVLYKSAIEMEKTNIGWVASDFSYIGDVFDGLNIPGIDAELYVNITKLIISKSNGNITFEIVLEDLNSSNLSMAKSLIQFIKPIIYMFLRQELKKLLTNDEMSELDRAYNGIGVEIGDENSISMKASLSIGTVSSLWRNYEKLIRLFSS